jgi:sugar phosphate isomerase/epimerase
MVGEVELVDLYWTSAGPVEVHTGREWSTFSWRDRCAQAARVGFTGLGLWHADVAHQLESTTLAEMKRIFDDAGLRHLEVEFLADFFADPGTPQRTASDALRGQLYETAATFGAHHIKVGNIPETPCGLDRLIEEYAALCDDAAQHTDARIAFEIIPFDPNVTTLQDGLRLVTEAGRPNGGLAIDTWHMGKLRIGHEQLAALPAEQIAWVEISDGPREFMDDPLDEVINRRALPGEGELDVAGQIRALQQAGYPGPWGVEVLSQELRAMPMEQQFDRAFETTAAQFQPTAA